MFTSVYLRNYKTFTDNRIDLSAGGNKAKSMVLFYGENGVGKSNLASVFFCFTELIRTMDVRDMFQDLMENYKEAANNEHFLQLLKHRFRDIETIITESRTIGTSENMILDFSFVINEKKGRYVIEMNSTEIVHERLEYTLDKNKGIYFDLLPGITKLNDKVFLNKAVQSDLLSTIEKFWGKHSLLAIIYHEFGDKSNSFLANAFSENFMNCLDDLFLVSCRVKKSNSPEFVNYGLRYPILSSLYSGQIDRKEISELKKTEKLLKAFLPAINPEINKVWYHTETKNDAISYRLYTEQLIAGELKEIPFSLESTGTHNLVGLLPFFLNAAQGLTVIVDELDTGIHDLLVKFILEDICKEIKGQIIITTHNTLVMSSEVIPSSSFYTIEKDDRGTRFIRCLTDPNQDNQKKRIHPFHNKQHQYLQGEYKAVPSEFHVSLKDLASVLE